MIQRSDSHNKAGLSRRSILQGTALLPMAPAIAGSAVAAVPAKPGSLARPGDFAPMGKVYLNSGTMHPVPLPAKASIETYLQARAEGRSWSSHDVEVRIKGAFARLISAAPEDLAFIQSTTAGEQLVVEALDLPAAGGSIVTDTLHFFGSFWLYQQLGEQGMDVRWIRPENGRIDPEAYEKAIGPDTRLVSISLVSTYNGFEHDLARICEIAHAHGALVYADIIHAAGTVPIDVKASGVDFASTASYKWLMGDFGLGFLYVRPDRLPQLKRPRYGYYQLARFRSHVYPYDTPGDGVADMAPRDDAEGMFAMGTIHTPSWPSSTGRWPACWNWASRISWRIVCRCSAGCTRHYRQKAIQWQRRRIAAARCSPVCCPMPTSAFRNLSNRQASPLRSAATASASALRGSTRWMTLST